MVIKWTSQERSAKQQSKRETRYKAKIDLVKMRDITSPYSTTRAATSKKRIEDNKWTHNSSIPPSQKSTRVDNQAKTRKKAEEANEHVPAGGTKTNTLNDSVKRAKQLNKTKRKDRPGVSKDSVN